MLLSQSDMMNEICLRMVRRTGCDLGLELTAGIVLELVRIAPGRFTMGSSHGLPSEEPVHEVTIGQPFLVGKYAVTQQQWVAVMGSNPSESQEDETLPVDQVSWDDCVNFCSAASGVLRRELRLPTEAQWEYACRAGSVSEFFFGDDPAMLPDHGWFDRNSRGSTRPVGRKKPNARGLYDMVGNVWEWCADVWHSDYQGAPLDDSAWTARTDAQPRRVLRGGSWKTDGFRCRSAYRSREWKHFATNQFGFRVALTA